MSVRNVLSLVGERHPRFVCGSCVLSPLEAARLHFTVLPAYMLVHVCVCVCYIHRLTNVMLILENGGFLPAVRCI